MIEQLTYLGRYKLQWREAPAPRLTSDRAALARPLAVATCDLDGLIIVGVEDAGRLPDSMRTHRLAYAVHPGLDRVGDEQVVRAAETLVERPRLLQSLVHYPSLPTRGRRARALATRLGTDRP